MKFVIGLAISFCIGVACRWFDIPVGSPSAIPGALLVVAMTMGYSSTSTILNRRNRSATSTHLFRAPAEASKGSAEAALSGAGLSRQKCSFSFEESGYAFLRSKEDLEGRARL
jgi:XapX domain-containing protein